MPSDLYKEGDVLNLSATASKNYFFDNWSGDFSSNDSITDLIIDSEKIITANFSKKKFEINVSIDGNGSVSKRLIKSGVKNDYVHGSIVEILAKPDNGWNFLKWSGDITSESTNPQHVVIDQTKNITAFFEEEFVGINTSKFLALGDSYTIGEGVNYDDRWPVQLLKELNKTTSKINNVEFIAKTGDTSSQLLSEMNNSNLEPPYGLISILIGVNNQFQGKSQQEFKDDFIKIIDKSIALLNGNKERLFVLSIPDWGATPFGSAFNRTQVSNQINQFNSIVKSESESRGIKFFNITDISRQALYDSSLIASDGLHPSGKMYALWVDRVIEYVSNLKY